MLLPIIVPIIAVISGFAPAGGNLPDTSQRSGITGTVYARSGNQMPAPNRKPAPDSNRKPAPDSNRKPSPKPGPNRNPGPKLPPGRGVRATVCIFRLTSDSQVVHTDPTHYRTILTPLVRQIETDENGHFQVFLPPGTYSVFTKKGELFYASRRDEKNHIAPVEVLPGKMTQVSCSVESDHKAVY